MPIDTIEAFERLTIKALKEEGSDAFIDRLFERKSSLNHLLKNGIELNEDTAIEWLEREKKILRRLEKERKKVLLEMEELAKNIKAAKVYAPRYPFPMMPVFLDRTG